MSRSCGAARFLRKVGQVSVVNGWLRVLGCVGGRRVFVVAAVGLVVIVGTAAGSSAARVSGSARGYRLVGGEFPRPRMLQGVVTGSISEGGSPVTLTISNAGDTGQLTFSGTTGDRVSLSITNVSIASSWVSIQNPDGSTLVSQTAVFTTGKFVDTVSLPQTGTYSIVRPPVIWSSRCVALSGCEAFLWR